MWSNLLWVGLGGFAGSVARYGTSVALAALFAEREGRFPWATLSVNLVGSFVIGLLLQHFETGTARHLLGVVGFCGGFTTFSTFSLESVRLLRAGETHTALLYIGLSLALCFGATALGMTIKLSK
ncbi:fluoride efflux transporter CrcB [uncultured Rikenella sp.]|uniref:fluoride efflux transporter CrcB n=1 Tax=uncultured Rikenella sp. TaxID=368003 RepID=UPI0025D438D1|nr:fluoride efflux transporter CrcB [uncultured Rikenella sp.]